MQENTYDSLNRPAGRKLPEWQDRTGNYEYDSSGNRIKMSEEEDIWSNDGLDSVVALTDEKMKKTVAEQARPLQL